MSLRISTWLLLYGNKRRGPGRPLKWVDKLVKKSTTPEDVSDDSDDEQLPDADDENSCRC